MSESDQVSEITSSLSEHNEDPLQDLTDEQLFRLLQETVRSNEVLDLETRMFEQFYKRSEPKEFSPLIVPGLAGAPTHEPSGTRIGRRRSKSRSSTTDRLVKLTAEQKCDIAQREIEELRNEIEQLAEGSQKIIDSYKDMMEEADLRQAEVKKECYEFDRDIIKGALNKRTKVVIAEKLMRHFDDKLRSRDGLIEKLRLKNSTLKVQKKKLRLQLKQKEEMGEILHEVDFNQLKIENQQYLEKIDERNQDLLRLKLMAGNTLQVLNSYKKKLNILTKEANRLRTEIGSRNELHQRIIAETEMAEKERNQAEAINKKLRIQLTDYKVPDVMEYVNEKAELYELQKKLKMWERKVEISEMALRTHKMKWDSIQTQYTKYNPHLQMQKRITSE